METPDALIQVEPGQEPPEFRFVTPEARVLRVHPLPACERMRATGQDLVFLIRMAKMIHAERLPLEGVITDGLLGDWLGHSVETASDRRRRRCEDSEANRRPHSRPLTPAARCDCNT